MLLPASVPAAKTIVVAAALASAAAALAVAVVTYCTSPLVPHLLLLLKPCTHSSSSCASGSRKSAGDAPLGAAIALYSVCDKLQQQYE
jgi:hypothetical protein